MRELSLFSGAGGGLLGSKILGWETVGYCEYDPYCQKIIKQRIADGILDPAPIFGDIRKFISEGYADAYQGMVDIVTGGFPCTDISIAKSNAKGLEGEASGLWNEMREIIGKARPKYAFVENSPALTFRGGARVIGDFASMGYDCRWGVVGGIIGTKGLLRERIWILAKRRHELCPECKKRDLDYDGDFWKCRCGWHGEILANDTEGNVFRMDNEKRVDSEMHLRLRGPYIDFSDAKKDWFVANGFASGTPDHVANWMDRVKAIGNGQVPLQMAYAYAKLSEGFVE